MGGKSFKLAGVDVPYNGAVIAVAALAFILLLRRQAAAPTLLMTSGIGDGYSGAMPPTPGVAATAPTLAGSGTPAGPPSATSLGMLGVATTESFPMSPPAVTRGVATPLPGARP